MHLIRNPQDNTGEDTLSDDELIKIFQRLLSSDRTEDCRDLAMYAWMTGTMGRSDDARLMYLADLLKPQLLKRIGKLGETCKWCDCDPTIYVLTMSVFIYKFGSIKTFPGSSRLLL